jgi:endonuclease I
LDENLGGRDAAWRVSLDSRVERPDESRLRAPDYRATPATPRLSARLRGSQEIAVMMLSIAFLFFGPGAWGQTAVPVSYYDAAFGKTGTVLKAALHSIIRGHTVLPYSAASTDTSDALKTLDEDPANSARVLLVYSGLTDLKSNQVIGSTGTWNREHLWPQSFGLVALNSEGRARSDLFNLRPVDENVNSSRGNKVYDRSAAPISIHPEAPGSSYDVDSWEPRDFDKGAIARAMFYMAVRYEGTDSDAPNLELSDSPSPATYQFGKLSTLLAWNRQFPPTSAERERNDRIYGEFQHNRNPFVDRPEYAEMVFNAVAPMEAWRRLRFTEAELTNAAVSGDLADPDQDGRGTSWNTH